MTVFVSLQKLDKAVKDVLAYEDIKLHVRKKYLTSNKNTTKHKTRYKCFTRMKNS